MQEVVIVHLLKKGLGSHVWHCESGGISILVQVEEHSPFVPFSSPSSQSSPSSIIYSACQYVCLE
jgi:hypothetical protein